MNTTTILRAPALAPLQLRHRRFAVDLINEHIERHAAHRDKIEILEAGCGRQWPFSSSKKYVITGVDLDAKALEYRKGRDLHHAIHGDLRDADLPAGHFDVIYSSFVLEHIAGARNVLDNFIRWTRPGGLIIVTFPNRDSVYGFFTRMTPFWVHVLYKKYVRGKKNAGKPGFAPYATVYDDVTSRREFRHFVAERGLAVVEEQAFGGQPLIVHAFMRMVQGLTLGRLSAKELNLMYVLRKDGSADTAS